ncbi:chemotaxis protein CheA [Pseudogemmatithrix spongiicola]|uniref:Chemotaxis protein CheA n=1 Tax=Pseudogemmatithrix spongiicola TaxID=3062599 RepID=A0AA49JZC4_9BACT|nr:chemotaxis protein CheA [Gemmatimonadaceae bacterium 'strain 138']WKW14887.1 chemotaxis protein CheA [Gemmatimonadaceae bacterium 'strain 318']
MDPSRYADLFRTESREQLSALNRALLAIEQGDDPAEPVAAIFRGVHTIKGMSATMGYSAVAEFSHELESLLAKVRDGEQSVSAELMDALFAAADALEDGIEHAREGTALTPAMQSALERLHDIAGGRSTAEFRVMRASGVVKLPAEALDPLDGEGTLVHVVQEPTAVLPGVRAFMAVQRLRALGEVLACVPSADALQAATTPQAFSVRMQTAAGAAELEHAVRGAGDVLSVRVEERAAAARPIVEAPSVTVESPSVTLHPMRRVSDILEATDALGPAERGAAPRARHVRIELARLDSLLDLAGELVIVRGRLQSLVARQGDAALREAMDDATRLIADLQSEIMTSRLVPVGQVFDRFPRLVRDVARALGKDVLFTIEGKEIELDRSVLDEIGEPVVHLLRNAVDHGLEAPAQREAAGKPRAGRLVLAAHRDRNAVVITVRDDGRGIDRRRVLARALQLGLVPVGTERLDDDGLLKCIAHPGFTTSDRVTAVSGRGVGVDAVISRVRALGGSVELRSSEGEGTTLALRLPVTLAIVRALLARVGAERYALPLTHVRETLERRTAVVQPVQGRDMLLLRDEVLPLLRLREVVQLPGQAAELDGEIVVIERGERRAALVVDELTAQEDIVVKAFDGARDGLALFSGATILADGAPALIVDVGSLL